eukprot:15435964-Alexandrium_andersonii.AAC.1
MTEAASSFKSWGLRALACIMGTFRVLRMYAVREPITAQQPGENTYTTTLGTSAHNRLEQLSAV